MRIIALDIMKSYHSSGAAEDLGKACTALLSALCMQWDTIHYKEAVSWKVTRAASMSGLSVATVIRARARLVEAGWLKIIEGEHRKRACQYTPVEKFHITMTRTCDEPDMNMMRTCDETDAKLMRNCGETEHLYTHPKPGPKPGPNATAISQDQSEDIADAMTGTGRTESKPKVTALDILNSSMYVLIRGRGWDQQDIQTMEGLIELHGAEEVKKYLKGWHQFHKKQCYLSVFARDLAEKLGNREYQEPELPRL